MAFWMCGWGNKKPRSGLRNGVCQTKLVQQCRVRQEIERIMEMGMPMGIPIGLGKFALEKLGLAEEAPAAATALNTSLEGSVAADA